jgi:hypothetical protein
MGVAGDGGKAALPWLCGQAPRGKVLRHMLCLWVSTILGPTGVVRYSPSPRPEGTRSGWWSVMDDEEFNLICAALNLPCEFHEAAADQWCYRGLIGDGRVCGSRKEEAFEKAQKGPEGGGRA